MSLELVGDLAGRLRRGDHVAARDVDLVGERQGDRLARHRLLEVAVLGDDAGNPALAPRRQRLDPVARAHRAAGDLAAKTAKVLIGAVDPLHRHPERLGLVVGLDIDRFEILHQGWAVVPGHPPGVLGDVVALQRRDRDGDDAVDPQRRREGAVVLVDRVADMLGPGHQVHLVDAEHDLAHPQHRDDEGVAPGLGQHPLAGVDQDHREVGGRGAGGHVAGILLVARGVGDDELALLGREEAVGDIDGDALLALGRQPIDQQGEIDPLALGAHLAAVGLQRRQLVLVDQLRLVEQPPDQGRLAVVDRTAGDEAQQAFLLVGLEVADDVGGDHRVLVGHQK